MTNATRRQDPWPTSHAQAQAEATQNTQAAPEKPKRSRSTLSMEKRLALAILAIIAVADKAKLKDPAVEAGRALVKDVNEKFIKPTQERIAVLKGEIKTAFAAEAPDYANIGKLSSELSKLEAKLKSATTV